MKLILILLIILLIILLFLFIVCGFVFNQIVWRKTVKVPNFIMNMIAGNSAPDEYEQKNAVAIKSFLQLPLDTVFVTTDDGAKLLAHILMPENPNGKLIVACHGARSSGIGEFAFMSKFLYKKGFTVIFPDHRGCGESDGKYMGYGTHESKDTFLWLDYAKKNFPDMPVFLLGVSMGAATVLMMSDNVDCNQVKGIIEDCSYTSAWDEFSYQLKTSFHLPNFPILHICNLYSKIFAGYSFESASPLNAVKNAKVPILFIHGKKDDFVPFYMRDILYNACPTEKYKLTVKNAVHARSYFTDSTAYELAVERFVDKCLESNND